MNLIILNSHFISVLVFIFVSQSSKQIINSMNPKSKKKFRHDKQVFNQNHSKFVVFLEKTMNGEMTVSKAIEESGIVKTEWYKLKKEYYRLNGLNS